MKKWFDKDVIKAIQISIISSVICAMLVEPIIQIGKNLSKGIIVALVDYFYYSCSRVNGVSFLNSITFIVFAWYTISILIDPVKALKGTVLVSKGEKTADRQNEEQQDSSDIGKNDSEGEHANKKSRIFVKIMGWICVISMILLFGYIFVYQYIPASTNVSFDRCITQITPYVEKERIDLLKSNWVSMKTKNDYEKILDEIGSILVKNGLSPS